MTQPAAASRAPAAPEKPRTAAFWILQRLHGLITAALFLVICFSLARFGARWSAWCELFTHFPLQYGLILLLGAAYCFAVASLRSGVVMLVFAAMNFSLLLPYAAPKALPPDPRDVIPIASLNVLIKNRNFRPTLSFLDAASPDVLVVSEVDDEWLRMLDSQRYPYSHKFPATEWLGLAIYSRFEIVDHEVFPAGSNDPYACAWTLKGKDREFVVVGAHPPPPDVPPNRSRQELLAEMGKFVAQFSKEKPTILIGDLNVTPWSPYFDQLLHDAELTDARIGQGVTQTWPTHFPPLWIPIDHCLVSKGVQVHGFWAAPSVESDHFPIVCRVSLAPAP
jgi:endonuclease/exonuclease/phosphatase (EEP) superfamily protein YafD